jgi:ribose transport system substrate-binding protein
VRIGHVDFDDPDHAGEALFSDANAIREADAVFAVWDEPAMSVVAACRTSGRVFPISTVDLGSQVALEIARGDLVVGAGAQLPYDQGVAEATAAIMALAGDEPPPWIVLPAMPVTRDNLIDAYQAVWHEPATDELREIVDSVAPG